MSYFVVFRHPKKEADLDGKKISLFTYPDEWDGRDILTDSLSRGIYGEKPKIVKTELELYGKSRIGQDWQEGDMVVIKGEVVVPTKKIEWVIPK